MYRIGNEECYCYQYISLTPLFTITRQPLCWTHWPITRKQFPMSELPASAGMETQVLQLIIHFINKS